MPTKKTRSSKPAVRTSRARNSAAADSYSNSAARIGIGTPNLAEMGGYPLTRLSQNYQLCLSLYRSSWIVRRVIDAYAEDMLKDFPVLSSEMKPKDIKRFGKTVDRTGTLDQMRSGLKWGRLFGGAIGLIVIKGHDDLMQPLELDDIEPQSYKGIIPLDRWSGVTPGAELIHNIDDTRNFGLPATYQCTTDSGVINVHHSRVLRFTGRELPNWERQVEQYWGLSEIELLFDELKKRDYTSWNIVSLLTRAQLLSITEPELAAMQSGAAMNNQAFTRYMDRMRIISEGMNNQGLMVLGKDGAMNQHTYSFGGVADVYSNFMLDIAGAAEYPVSRLFGRSVSGLGQTGEGDLQIYYDNVEQKRKRELGPQMEKIMPIIAMSEFGTVPDDLDYTWPPVRTLSDKDRAELAKQYSEAILAPFNAGVYGQKTTLKELKQQSTVTGLFSNITDEMIEKASDDPMMPGEGDLFGMAGEEGGSKNKGAEENTRSAADRSMADADRTSDQTIEMYGLTIRVENDKGSTRSGTARDGKKWSVTFIHPYGYIVGMMGADGDSLDCFVGPAPESDKVFVIEQNDLDGNYDEDKVMLGYRSAEEAMGAYFQHYDRPEAFFGSLEQMSIDQFKAARAEAVA